MSIVEDIRSYTDKLDMRFALAHYIKLYNLAKDVQRYITKELKGERNLQFTSQDLRSLIMAIERTLRSINKKISFVEFTKTLEKYKKVDNKILEDESKNFAKYCGCAKYLYSTYMQLNHYAVLVYLIELEAEQQKEKSDKEFTDSVIYTLLEYIGGIND